MITKNKESLIIEYGDYQTPLNFSQSVCRKLKEIYYCSPTIIIEPTFGIGNFIKSSLTEFNIVNIIYGAELNENYYSTTFERFYKNGENLQIDLYNADIFSFDFSGIKKNILKNDNVLDCVYTNSDIKYR